MCVRRKQKNAKTKLFAAQTVNNNVDAGSVQPMPAPAAPIIVAMPPTVSGSKEAVQEAREKEQKIVSKPLIPTILGSAELMRRRKDDDTLREVGNTMPEYDCDRDDPPKIVVERTQDSIDAKTARLPSGLLAPGSLEKPAVLK
ncbi:unnamed protein product [Cylicocyclus nassatus]|uniref:Uncharacterized protein n=1 Tax=Cylicocyclus nassatus TaxID=53992 RepID=A0AA36DJT7_CYLNA|nr:unnamed protein product [Cylicocyclus nassatus]